MKTLFCLLVFLCFTATSIHAAPGDLDSLDVPIGGGHLYTVVVQPDGKTIIAGTFTSVSGVPKGNIARLNADGTLDTGFNPSTNSLVESIVVQPDGKILLAGDFTSVSGTTRNRVARLHADGTLDLGFNPNVNDYMESMTLQADGKILLVGGFSALQPNGAAEPTTRNRIARLHASGALDASFNPNVYGVIFRGA